MSRLRYFTIDRSATEFVVRFRQRELFGTVGEIVFDELLRLVERSRPQALLFDFQDVKIFGSSLLNCLVRLKNELDRMGISIKLCAMQVPLHEICRIMNVTENDFQTFDSVSNALLGSGTLPRTTQYGSCPRDATA